MQRWEYCELDSADAAVRVYGTNGTESQPIKRDPAKGDHTTRDAWRRAIAELGQQGWEMVGLRQSTKGGYHLYFKRPLDHTEPA